MSVSAAAASVVQRAQRKRAAPHVECGGACRCMSMGGVMACLAAHGTTADGCKFALRGAASRKRWVFASTDALPLPSCPSCTPHTLLFAHCTLYSLAGDIWFLRSSALCLAGPRSCPDVCNQCEDAASRRGDEMRTYRASPSLRCPCALVTLLKSRKIAPTALAFALAVCLAPATPAPRHPSTSAPPAAPAPPTHPSPEPRLVQNRYVTLLCVLSVRSPALGPRRCGCWS